MHSIIPLACIPVTLYGLHTVQQGTLSMHPPAHDVYRSRSTDQTVTTLGITRSVLTLQGCVYGKGHAQVRLRGRELGPQQVMLCVLYGTVRCGAVLHGKASHMLLYWMVGT